MTEIRNTKMVEQGPDGGDLRTLQALDQAAGGSGKITSEQARKTSSPKIRPEHGTDDARCEDSAESDRQRMQTSDEVSFRISQVTTGSGPKEAGEGTTERSPASSARKQGRTDLEIRAEIEDRLRADQLLNEASIFVTVSRGRVVIEGSVENHEAKQRAEAISRQANGIVGHDSNLAVRKPS